MKPINAEISIHALREEGDLQRRGGVRRMGNFYPRPPRGGRPAWPIWKSFATYFYPRPPRGGRLCKDEQEQQRAIFLSTPSARRATFKARRGVRPVMISIHALREEGDRFLFSIAIGRYSISIHALREEGDDHPGLFSRGVDISIHALREEGDTKDVFIPLSMVEFLSTPSARRATAKTETKSLFSNKLYNILHEFRRALIYNGSKSYPNHAK